MEERTPLQITNETVLVAIPRGDEELRVSYTQARTGDGKDISWHSLRIFWKNQQGEWKPGKQGITLRHKELKGVTEALLKAAGGSAARVEVAPPMSDAQFWGDEP